MRPANWINRLGTAIVVPSIIALFILCVELTPPVRPGLNENRLFGLAVIIGVMAIIGFELMFYRRGYPMNATKPLSPAQKEEMREARGVVRMLIEMLAFSVACGTVLTLFGLKLIKLLVGVDSFGFRFWTWLSIHSAIFLIGAIGSIALAYLIVVLVARWCRATYPEG